MIPSPANCDEVYGTAGYEASVANLAGTSLSRDLVFSDGVTLQLPAMTGSVSAGLIATLQVTIRA